MKTLALLPLITLLSFSTHATIISFDDGDPFFQQGKPGKNGSIIGSEVSGDPIKFDDFRVSGSLSLKNLTTTSTFKKSQTVKDVFAAYQDSGDHAGLGVYKKDGSIGSDDSFQSNTASGSAEDEILIFKFVEEVIIESMWFNGNHEETVDKGANKGKNAVFNIFFSDDGKNYNSVFDDSGAYRYARAPIGGETLDTNWLTGHQFWAVAATGWGDHSSYLEGMEYSTVPTPATLSLFTLGLIGIGAARRRKQV